MIVDPQDLGNKRFVVEKNHLRYFAARKAVITAGSYDANHQLVLIVFNRDGSIFISCPYSPASEGIVSVATFPEGNKAPLKISMREQARATSHRVKLSHHPDGHVLFSQDGRVKSELRRSSFQLSRYIGELARLFIFWPGAFEPITLADKKRDRAYCTFIQKGGRLPPAIAVILEWRRKKSIVDNVEPPNEITGPVARVRDRRTGAEGTAAFLGQPDTHPLQDHVVMIHCYETDPIKGMKEASVILLGGFDVHEVPDASEVAAAELSGCLAFMYPWREYEALRRRCGTIDFDTDDVLIQTQTTDTDK